MGNLPAAKKYRNLHPLALADKLTNVSHFVLDIVGIRPRTHFHFFDLEHGMFFGSVGLLLLFVAIFSVVHHATNRWLRIRRHLHQVQALSLNQSQGFVKWQDTELLPLSADHAYFTHTNLMVNPRFSGGASDKTPPWVVGRS